MNAERDYAIPDHVITGNWGEDSAPQLPERCEDCDEDCGMDADTCAAMEWADARRKALLEDGE